MLSVLFAAVLGIGGCLPVVRQRAFPTSIDLLLSAISPDPQRLKLGSRNHTDKGQVEMAYVPSGEFVMGSDTGPSDERPLRRVFLDAYWIGVDVVTVAQFREYCADAGVDFSKLPAPKWGWRNDNPMVNVTWDEARAYCRWAGGDLPTEAQWEKAARGTDARLYPWGNEWSRHNLWCSLKTPADAGSTTPVGSYPKGASPCGCLDMAGNMFQWCLDWQGPYDPAELRNPTGPSSGPGRVLRGGSWTFFRPEFFHSSTRTLYNPPIQSNHGFGFRVAAGIPIRLPGAVIFGH